MLKLSIHKRLMENSFAFHWKTLENQKLSHNSQIQAASTAALPNMVAVNHHVAL